MVVRRIKLMDWDTFHSMKGTPGVTATLTGGSEEPRTGSLVGPMAVRQ
jgi:hypothetical protein